MADVMDNFMSAMGELKKCNSEEVMKGILRSFGIVVERNIKNDTYNVYKDDKLIYENTDKWAITRLLTYTIQDFSIKFLGNMNE